MLPPVRRRRRAGKLLNNKVSCLRAEIKGGVQYSAAYVKDTAVSSTRAVKERDWSKEKKLAEDAGVATKECASHSPGGRPSAVLGARSVRVGDAYPLGCRAAVKVGAAAQKGSSWLYSKGKELMNGGVASKPGGAPPRSQSRY